MAQNNNLPFHIQKLDRRMNGYGMFSHRLVFTHLHSYRSRYQTFLTTRHWFFENIGLGCELDMFDLADEYGFKYTWAWDTEGQRLEIFVSERELSALIMHFPVDNQAV